MRLSIWFPLLEQKIFLPILQIFGNFILHHNISGIKVCQRFLLFQISLTVTIFNGMLISQVFRIVIVLQSCNY